MVKALHEQARPERCRGEVAGINQMWVTGSPTLLMVSSSNAAGAWPSSCRDLLPLLLGVEPAFMHKHVSQLHKQDLQFSPLLNKALLIASLPI